jgi:hypothetical protein
MQRRERYIKIANGVQADVEAVGDLSLELADGFVLLLRDVLYIPTLQRNLIYVSCLDNDEWRSQDFKVGYSHIEKKSNA